MTVVQRGTRLLAARGWSRHGQSVMRTRVGVPELVGLYLWEWRHERWLGDGDLSPVFERGLQPTGRREWLVGSPEELAALGLPDQPAASAHRPASPAPAAREAVRGGWTRPDRRFLQSLPHDPPALLESLLAAHPATQFLGVLDQVARVPAVGLLPDAVAHALIEVLRAQPGIVELGEVPDLWDRSCSALRHELQGNHHDLLLDPDTGTYRGYREIAGEQSSTPVAAGSLLCADVLVFREDVEPGHVPVDLDT